MKVLCVKIKKNSTQNWQIFGNDYSFIIQFCMKIQAFDSLKCLRTIHLWVWESSLCVWYIMNMNKSSTIKHLFKEDKFGLVPNQTSIGVWFDKVLVELQFYK